MKRLISLITLVFLVVGLSLALSACGCSHTWCSVYPESVMPTCQSDGYSVEYRRCEKCGADDPSFTPTRWPMSKDPNAHISDEGVLAPAIEAYRVGMLDRVFSCIYCDLELGRQETEELDPEFECPPHIDYDYDNICDSCDGNMSELNCPGHENDGNGYCIYCGSYIGGSGTEEPEIYDIYLDKYTCLLDVGDTHTFVASWYPSEIEAELIWSTRTPQIISVDENGVVTALSDGVGVVTVALASNENIYVEASVYIGNFAVTFNFEECVEWRDGDYEGYKLVGVNTPYLPDTVTIPSEYNGQPVVIIGSGAFRSLSGFTKVIIPDSVKLISSGAFLSCPDLTDVVLPDGLEHMYSYSFEGCDSINYTVDSTGKYLGNENNPYLALIAGAEGATSYEAKPGTRVICDSAFLDNTALSTVDLGGAISIGWQAFRGTGITEVVIPDTTTVVNSEAFRECTSLKSITIGKNVTDIYSYAFLDCTAVNYVYYNAASLSDVLGGNAVFSFRSFELSDSEKTATVVIGPDVVRIPNLLFSRAFNEASVTLDLSSATSLVEIGTEAFYAISNNLTEAVIPATVKTVGDRAFKDNYNLSSIRILGAPDAIGEEVFYGCNYIKSLYIGTGGGDIRELLPEGCYSDALEITVGKDITALPTRFLGSTFTPDTTGYNTAVSLVFENGSQLTEIGERAFERLAVSSVTLPDGVRTIGDYAFLSCNKLTELNLNPGLLEIGQLAFARCTALGAIPLPESLTTVGNSAFSNCTDLSEITFPASISSIGQNALAGCTSLLKATLPDSLTVIPAGLFDGCSSLTSIPSYATITEIGSAAFRGTALSELEIPTSLRKIGEACFADCTKLGIVVLRQDGLETALPANIFAGSGSNMTIYIGKDVTYIPAKLFYSEGTAVNAAEIEFEDGSRLTTINEYAFAGLKSVKSLNIPDTVTYIGARAFNGMTSLTEINLTMKPGMNLTANAFKGVGDTEGATLRIGKNSACIIQAFADANITSVVFEDGCEITEIGAVTFNGWSHLKSVTLHEGLLSVDLTAFFECPGVTSLGIPASVTEIRTLKADWAKTSTGDPKILTLNIAPENATYKFEGGALYSKDGKTLVWYPAASAEASFTVPSTVTAIGEGAFAYARGLSSLTIPTSVTVIPDYAFYVANRLKSVNLDHVTEIGSYAFAYTAIDSFEAPSGVTEIKDYTFYKSSLENLVLGSQVVSIGDYAFYQTSLNTPSLSEGLCSIGNYAFYNCEYISALGAVVIPDSVNSIGVCAFGYNPTDLNNFGGNAHPTVYIEYSGNYTAGWYDSHCSVTKKQS